MSALTVALLAAQAELPTALRRDAAGDYIENLPEEREGFYAREADGDE